MSLKKVWIQTAMGLLACSVAADSAFISTPLLRTGIDPNAGGLVTVRLGATNSSLLLQASNLTAGRTYTMVAGGVARGRFVANATGRGQLRFARPAAGGALALDFDPQGNRVLVMEAGQAVLRGVIAGTGEARGSVVEQEVRLPRVPGSAGGRADASYELTGGTRRFSVSLTNIGDGTYRMFVNGIRRGEIVVSGGTGSIAFDNDAATAERGLNFDPRGVVIDIAKGSVLRFSGAFLARAQGVNLATPSVITRVIPSTTTSSSGVALARRWVTRDGRREFDVELFNVVPADYELFVNGVFQGLIPVFAGPFGSAGELQFSTDADDEDERPLGFNPFTSLYAVVGPGGILFQGLPLATTVQVTNIADVAPSEIELPLFNLGVDADGTARAQLKTDDRGRRHFEIDLRNVPSDFYMLLVNEVPNEIIWVNDVAGGTRGILEFEDEPEVGEETLDFDPHGKVIAIERGGTRYFERALPAIP